jgi:hypothetical protein
VAVAGVPGTQRTTAAGVPGLDPGAGARPVLASTGPGGRVRRDGARTGLSLDGEVRAGAGAGLSGQDARAGLSGPGCPVLHNCRVPSVLLQSSAGPVHCGGRTGTPS